MAKSGKASAKKPRGKKPDKPRKVSAEQLSDMDRQRLLLAHKRKLRPLLETETNAKGAVTKAYELAKKEGITKEMLKTAFLLDTDEGTEKMKVLMQQHLDVLRYTGSALGEQLDMFPKPTVLAKAFEDGKRSALSDEPARPPASLSQSAANEWLAGHSAGRQAQNVARAEQFKPLGSVVKEVIGDQADSIKEAA